MQFAGPPPRSHWSLGHGKGLRQCTLLHTLKYFSVGFFQTVINNYSCFLKTFQPIKWNQCGQDVSLMKQPLSLRTRALHSPQEEIAADAPGRSNRGKASGPCSPGQPRWETPPVRHRWMSDLSHSPEIDSPCRHWAGQWCLPWCSTPVFLKLKWFYPVTSLQLRAIAYSQPKLSTQTVYT